MATPAALFKEKATVVTEVRYASRILSKEGAERIIGCANLPNDENIF